MDYIMDFGKYKGQDLITVIQEDKDYINWCAKNIDNPEFQEALETGGYQGIEKRSDTIAHNKLQLKFLSEELCWQTVTVFKQLHLFQNRDTYSADGGVVTREGRDRWRTPEAVFEHSSIDVSIGEVHIELKPTIGEDYPEILRQIQRANKTRKEQVQFLVVDKITTVTASLSMLKDYFYRAGIDLVTLQEIQAVRNVAVVKQAIDLASSGDFFSCDASQFDYDLVHNTDLLGEEHRHERLKKVMDFVKPLLNNPNLIPAINDRKGTLTVISTRSLSKSEEQLFRDAWDSVGELRSNVEFGSNETLDKLLAGNLDDYQVAKLVKYTNHYTQNLGLKTGLIV